MSANRAPLVSIGVPVFNGERYVAETLDSLLAQTFRDIEVVVADNGSTDRTPDIVRGYVARDPRVRHVRSEENRGAAWNYRRVARLAHGRYFKWAASDDLVAPTFIQRCLDALAAHPEAVLAYPRTRIIDEHGRAVEDFDDRLHLVSASPSDRLSSFLRNVRLTNAVYGLMPTAVLRRTPMMANYVGSDICLLAELSLRGTFREIPEVLFFRRFHPSCSSMHRDAEHLTVFFDPSRRARRVRETWRHIFEYWRFTTRVPLTTPERMRTARILLRQTWWARQALLQELL